MAFLEVISNPLLAFIDCIITFITLNLCFKLINNYSVKFQWRRFNFFDLKKEVDHGKIFEVLGVRKILFF